MSNERLQAAAAAARQKVDELNAALAELFAADRENPAEKAAVTITAQRQPTQDGVNPLVVRMTVKVTHTL